MLDGFAAVARTKMTRSKEAILGEVVREDRRIAELERALAGARASRERLWSEPETVSGKTSQGSSPSSKGNGETPQTPSDKVRLFRDGHLPDSLREQEDRQDRVRSRVLKKDQAGFCILKTGSNCGECPNQAWDLNP